MKQKLVKTVLVSAMLLVSSPLWAETTQVSTQLSPVVDKEQKKSGVELKNFDQSVNLKDDFYQHVNGTWLKNNEIPADQSEWGIFKILRENSVKDLHNIVEELSEKQWGNGTNEQKVADLYASYMDEKKLETLGIQPIQEKINKIEALKSKSELGHFSAKFQQLGVNNLLNSNVIQDFKNTSEMTVVISQNGLGLPDRDYYLLNDEKFKQIRYEYLTYIQKTLDLAGDQNAAQHAQDILKLETEIAQIHISNVENRNIEKLYHKYNLDDLSKLSTQIDLKKYLQELGYSNKINSVIVVHPTYAQGLGSIINKTSLEIWKAYLKFHLVSDFSPYLSSTFANNHFEFNSHILNGVQEQKPRWNRGMQFVDDNIGESLGQVYVKKHFSPEKKQRMEQMVQNLLASYKVSFEQVNWLSDVTKEEALKKLSTFRVNIGYPNKWKDYSSLAIQNNDLVGNIIRMRQFAFQYELNKLGNPVDRDEWPYTPQTVGAGYRPLMSDITFPAAILQPPFFDMNADDAINYGAIGAVIGHEIGHGFDDQGSMFDEQGNLRNWWTKEDRKKYKDKTQVLVQQYGAYEPVKGIHVNGELTLGENIGDNSGLAIAYKAYKKSLNGQTAPIIDNFTGDQRFYIGWTQVWRSKIREAKLLDDLKTDVHSPDEIRGNQTLKNQKPFYDAFSIKEGDGMYLAPDKRVTIW